jgi:hypothetical protein
MKVCFRKRLQGSEWWQGEKNELSASTNPFQTCGKESTDTVLIGIGQFGNGNFLEGKVSPAAFRSLFLR